MPSRVPQGYRIQSSRLHRLFLRSGRECHLPEFWIHETGTLLQIPCPPPHPHHQTPHFETGRRHKLPWFVLRKRFSLTVVSLYSPSPQYRSISPFLRRFRRLLPDLVPTDTVVPTMGGRVSIWVSLGVDLLNRADLECLLWLHCTISPAGRIAIPRYRRVEVWTV